MQLDHLVLAISDLDAGIAQLKKLTGVRAVKGGRHPDLGTQNALVALGDRSYLEILAPSQDTGVRPKAATSVETPLTRLVGRAFAPPREELTLIAWAVAARRMEELDVRFRALGYVTTGVHEGWRFREDGKRLAWQMLAVTAPDDPLLPFWIDWAPDSEHPSHDAPSGCQLEKLYACDPDPDRAKNYLEQLDLDLAVEKGEKPGLVATIKTKKGTVELRS